MIDVCFPSMDGKDNKARESTICFVMTISRQKSIVKIKEQTEILIAISSNVLITSWFRNLSDVQVSLLF